MICMLFYKMMMVFQLKCKNLDKNYMDALNAPIGFEPEILDSKLIYLPK